ncbi:MAG TPA: CBS domain-containing protein [Alphaproteobacteria bacterium]|nr:CBS domain-containing protein [Alphaproteobacteria bacterium]
MKAGEVMTTDVVSVGPDASESEIAKLMLARGISGVPVVDAAGVPLGMVSEGDLIGRPEPTGDARKNWWLDLLAEGEALNPDFLAHLRAPGRKAREIMSTPLVSVTEHAECAEIARLLATYRIKRVPVLRDDRIVGIVSRADLLRALAAEAGGSAGGAGAASAAPAGVFAAIDRRFFHNHHEVGAPAPAPAPSLAAALALEPSFSVDDFRHLVEDYKFGQGKHRLDATLDAAQHRRALVQAMIDKHIADPAWQALLHEARVAAERGDKEFMLLRFPSELCSDRGRAINLPEPDWPETLRGEAAEIYLRWQRDLHPRGFRLAARVLDYPGGFPGDIGLFLIWGE